MNSEPFERFAWTRRQMLGASALGLGRIALGSTLLEAFAGRSATQASPVAQAAPAARAKRIVYLFQAGGPSQFETFDPKPLLSERRGEPLPDSVRQGQRLTGMSGNQAVL